MSPLLRLLSVAVAPFRLIQPDPPTDRQLIERTLAGDEEAYAIVVERYQKRIYRVALAILRNEGDADMVTQDTFVRAYLNLRRFEGRSELETWLTRIAINRARDLLRGPRWLSLGSQDDERPDSRVPEPIDPRPDAERVAAGGQLIGAIERAVERLPEQQKAIFRLRHYEEISLEKIAEMMNLRPGTVRAHLFRAVRRVRRELKDWMPAGRLSAESTE